MPTFLLALAAVTLATLGGREAVRVARLSAALGASVALILTGWLACLFASVLAAWLGAAVAAALTAGVRNGIVAAVLLAAAAELVLLRPGPSPAEPTRSFGAVLLVLGATLLTAPAGLLVFAFASATGQSWSMAAAGALGSAAVFAAAWTMAGDWEARMPLSLLRPGVAAFLLVAALATAWSAWRGL